MLIKVIFILKRCDKIPRPQVASVIVSVMVLSGIMHLIFNMAACLEIDRNWWIEVAFSVTAAFVVPFLYLWWGETAWISVICISRDRAHYVRMCCPCTVILLFISA